MKKDISDYMSIDSLYTFCYHGVYVHCHYNRPVGKYLARCTLFPGYYSLEYLKRKIREYLSAGIILS